MDGSSDGPAAATPAKRRLGDLGLRAASGLVLVAIAISTARQEPGGPFVLVWVAASIAVLYEWQRLVGGERIAARIWIGVAGLVAIGASAYPTGFTMSAATHVDIEFCSFCIAAAAIGQGMLAGARSRLWAPCGMLYAGMLLTAVLALRFSFPDGVRSIMWLFAVVWSSDIFAYLGGRLIGGAKLWPRISPSKTWSGTAVGLVAGSLVGTFAAVRDVSEPTSAGWVFVLSFAAAFLSQVGDAGESAMKRHFGVKDSGSLIPGHGGVMDRLDGFVAAAVFALVFGVSRDLASVANGLFYWP